MEAAAAENSVRIRTDRLDQLVDMVGELVIAHSMLSQDPVVLRDRQGLSRKVDHTAKILRELQDLSTSLRMVPLKPAFLKVSRVVRDLSRKSGKKVRWSPKARTPRSTAPWWTSSPIRWCTWCATRWITGIETAAERRAAGKPPEGTIQIAAYQAGGNVIIEVSDDGRG